MAQIYGILNQLYVKFVTFAVDSFPEIEDLKTEKDWLLEKMQENAINTLIYDHYKVNLDKISEKVHTKNPCIFLEEQYEDVALIKHLSLKKVFSRLLDDEYDIVWQSLQNIVKQMGLAQSVGSCIPSVQNLLKKFQEKNPNIDMRGPGVQALMMKQLLSDPDFGKQAASMFNDQDEETSILANIPDKLRALGLTTMGTGAMEETKEEDKQDEEEEEVLLETKTNDASDLFKKTIKNRKRAKKPAKNVFAEVASMMQNQKLDSPDFSDIRKEINSVFDGTNPDQPDIEKMMEQFSTTGNFGSGFDPKSMMESMGATGFDMGDIFTKLQQSMKNVPPKPKNQLASIEEVVE